MKKVLVYFLFIVYPCLVFSQSKIKSFYFENDKSVPTPYSQNQLSLFKKSFNKGEVVILEIYSYTDSIGSVEYNDSLAKKRLSYITNFLNITPDSSVRLKPYGLVRKYDVKDYKSWRRVDIYYQHSDGIIKQLIEPEIIQENTTVLVDTLIETPKTDTVKVITKKKKEEDLIDDSFKKDLPYILNIEFIGGTDIIEQKSYPEIKKMYTYLISYPTAKILVRGHVCCGNNMRISRNRAKAVYKELIKMGIHKSRLDYIGMSNTEPIVFPEITNEDRQRNRRVDVKFIFSEK